MSSVTPATARLSGTAASEQANSHQGQHRPTVFRIIVVYAGWTVMGGLSFFGLSYANAGFELGELNYHLAWTSLGFFAGLAFATTAHLAGCQKYGRCGGALVGLAVGAIAAPLAMASWGLLGKPMPEPGVLATAAFFGAIFYGRIGMRLVDTP